MGSTETRVLKIKEGTNNSLLTFLESKDEIDKIAKVGTEILTMECKGLQVDKIYLWALFAHVRRHGSRESASKLLLP